MKIKINYRTDKRIKVVEIRTGTKAFLHDLEEFALVTGIRDFEEPTGVANIPADQYTTLWRGRINHAEPHSFKFRRSKESQSS